MTPLSTLISELKALEAKATKGPWGVLESQGIGNAKRTNLVNGDKERMIYQSTDYTEQAESWLSESDFKLIEQMRNALPRLLEELGAHRDMLRKLEWEIEIGLSNKFCPLCNDKEPKHAQDCAIAALLSRWEPQEKVGEG